MLPQLRFTRAFLALSLALGGVVAGLSASVAVSTAGGVPTYREISITAAKSLGSGSSDILLSSTNTSTFNLVGVTWTAPAAPAGEFMVKTRESGVWSDWVELHYEAEHAPDTGEGAARYGANPLLTDPADGVALRYLGDDATPTDIRLVLIDSRPTSADRTLARNIAAGSGSPESAASASPSPSVSPSASSSPSPSPSPSQTTTYNTSPTGAIVDMPSIVTRAQWGANERIRDSVMDYGTTIKAGFVHHTVSAQDYSAADVPAMLRGIQLYHVNGQGWADIGYNFLVDKFGTLYEGRFGGMNEPVRGAHTLGFNTDTFAVSVIGNYDANRPTATQAAAITDSISHLMAWKFAKYGTSATTTVRLTSASNTGKFNTGQTATLKTISGHRDAVSTACPGRYMYEYLPAIRTATSALLQPGLRDAIVTPRAIEATSASPAVVNVTMPAAAAWQMKVINPLDGTELWATSGTAANTEEMNIEWNRTNSAGEAVGEGTYRLVLSAQVGSTVLPSKSLAVVVGTKANPVKKLKLTNTKKSRVVMTWSAPTAVFPEVIAYYHRVSKDNGKTWGGWKKVTTGQLSVTYKTWKPGSKVIVEVRAKNSVGYSNVVRKTFIPKR